MGGLVCAVAVLAGPSVALPATGGADPVQEALEARDAYVSPRVSGSDAAARERQLAASAARLTTARRPVKLALILGPAGAPSLQFYARRLAARLHYEGTLIVTTRGGGIAATGPRPTAEMTRALRAADVGRIADPVARLARAADVAAPAATDLEREGRRSTLVLVVLALLGGGWAAAIGVGRGNRRARQEAADARARMRVCLDALRARAIALARRPDLAPAGRAGVERALGTYADAVSALPQLARAEQVDALAPDVRSALDQLAAARATLDGAATTDDIFAGLCATDPAHGPVAGGAGDDALDGLCARCHAERIEGGTPAPRMLSQDGRPVPFDAARYGPVLRPEQPR